MKYVVVATLVLLSLNCRVERRAIGGNFVVKTRIYMDLGHEYRERDLYRRTPLGFSVLIEKDISGAIVSPSGDAVLYIARRKVADSIEGSLKLYLEAGHRTVSIADGRFSFESDWWSPSGTRFVYKKRYEEIVVFEIDGEKQRYPVRGDAQQFLGWSPSGAMIAHSTGESIYKENSLFITDVDLEETRFIATKTGRWVRSDFEWTVQNGSETVRLQ